MQVEDYWWGYGGALYATEINEFLHDVLQMAVLEGAAHGIALQALDRGIESLSVRQAAVFDRDIIQAHAYQACARCGGAIPWAEMATSEGYCSYCAYMGSTNDARLPGPCKRALVRRTQEPTPAQQEDA